MENFSLILNRKVSHFVNFNVNISRPYFHFAKVDYLFSQVLRVIK